MAKSKTPDTESEGEGLFATEYDFSELWENNVVAKLPSSPLCDEIVLRLVVTGECAAAASVSTLHDDEVIVMKSPGLADFKVSVRELRSSAEKAAEGVPRLPDALLEGLDKEQASVMMDAFVKALARRRHESEARERTLSRTAPSEPYTAATDPDLIDWRFGCGSHLNDPGAMLARMEQAYLAGDRTAVMAAVFICCGTYPDFSSDEPFRDMWTPHLPDWVRTAFHALYSEVLLAKGNTKSWDEAFGSPHPKNRKLTAYRKKIDLAGQVYLATQAARLAGRPLDEVCEEFGISRTVAEEYQRLVEDRLYRPRSTKPD